MKARKQDAGEDRRGGSILILAVWVLFFLTALAVAVGSQVGAMLALAGHVRDHVALRALGQAGAMRSAAVISGSTNTWDGLTEASWTRDPDGFGEQALGGGRFRVGYLEPDHTGTVVTNTGVRGESGRLNINKANAQLLGTYFQVAGGLSSPEAEALARAVHARVNPDQERLTVPGFPGYDVRESSSGAARAGPFLLLDELRQIPGMRPGLFEQIAPGLTVFGDGLINVNTASREVLHSLALAATEARLAGAAASLAVKLVAFRRDGNAFTGRDSQAMKAAFYDAVSVTSEEKECFERITGRLTVASTHFRGITLVQLDHEGRETIGQEFVFDKSGKRFVYWREL